MKRLILCSILFATAIFMSCDLTNESNNSTTTTDQPMEMEGIYYVGTTTYSSSSSDYVYTSSGVQFFSSETHNTIPFASKAQTDSYWQLSSQLYNCRVEAITVYDRTIYVAGARETVVDGKWDGGYFTCDVDSEDDSFEIVKRSGYAGDYNDAILNARCTDIEVVNGDVHVVGYYDKPYYSDPITTYSVPFYAKNGAITTLVGQGIANTLSVASDGTVFIGGKAYYDGDYRTCYWLASTGADNGYVLNSNDPGEITDSAVDGEICYFSAWVTAGSNEYAFYAAVDSGDYFDSEYLELSGDSTALGIFIRDSTVYISGYYNSSAVVWVDTERQSLPAGYSPEYIVVDKEGNVVPSSVPLFYCD